MPDSFEEFLKKKTQSEKPVDWVGRKNQWVSSVDLLYRNISIWLTPFTTQSLLKVEQRQISLYEQYIGHYSITELNIIIGNNIIYLTPKGTIILGSYGRIDIRGPKDDIIIVEQKWNEWKFVDKYNKLNRWDVNDDSFKAIIQRLI